MKDDLIKVRDWAQAKLDARQEPPWAVAHYRNLVQTIDDILAAQASTITLEESLRLQDQSARAPQLPACIVRIGSARRRSTLTPVQLPM